MSDTGRAGSARECLTYAIWCDWVRPGLNDNELRVCDALWRKIRKEEFFFGGIRSDLVGYHRMSLTLKGGKVG
jgi:hypothetical protein